MAKKRKVSNAVKKAPGGYTTLPIGEEGIPSYPQYMTTMLPGEEGIPHHPSTLAMGEETPFTTHIWGEEGHVPSIQIAENPPSTITAELGPIFNPGGPVEQPVAKAVKARAARKRRT
jgi:hypothetical protein